MNLDTNALEAAADAVTMAARACGVELFGADEDIFAERAVSAYLAAALPEVTSAEQWDSLPIGTMVRVHFNGNSELVIRCPAGSGAGIGGMSFLGGRHWSDVFTVWNADKLEIKYIPEVKP